MFNHLTALCLLSKLWYRRCSLVFSISFMILMLIDIKIKRVIVLNTQLFRSLPPVTEIDNTVGSVLL